MKRLMVAVALMSVTGCLCAKECSKSEDCPMGQICGSQGLCEAPGGTGGGTSGGTGGSTAGGASGGTMGGGTAGGGTMAGGVGGGMGGGAASPCSPVCGEWQVCDTTGTAPACGNTDIQVSDPTPGFVTETGVMLRVAAALTYDGGVIRRNIPVSGAGLTGVMVPSNGMINIPTPAAAGFWALQLGWDGGRIVERQVEVRGCNGVSCGEWQSCTGTVDGGRCADGVESIVWSAPDAGVLGPAVTVPAVVTVTMFDGGVFAGAVPVAGPVSASLTGATNLKQGMLTTPTANGPFTVTAGWDGGPTAPLTARVDAQGPGLTLVVEDAPARLTQELDPVSGVVLSQYKKDETAFVRVEANEDANFAAAMVSPAATPVAGSQCTGCMNSARCQCFSVNLEPLPLNALRGTLGLSVSNVRDVFGNLSQTADGGIQVTRWKWNTTLPDGFSARAAPALDSKGRLYVGTIDANNNNNGNVYQIGRQGQVALFVSGAAVQSIAIADSVMGSAGARQEIVYIASNTSVGGNLHGRLLDGGVPSGSGASGCYNSFGLAKTYTAVALFDAGLAVGGMEVGAAGMFEPNGGTGVGGALCGYRPFNGPSQLTEATTTDWVAPAVPNPSNSATNMVAVDESIYLLQTNRELRRFVWNAAFSSSAVGGAIATSGTPVSLAASQDRLFATVSSAAVPFVSMSKTGAEQVGFGGISFAASGPVVLGPSTSMSVPAPALAYASTTASTGAFLQSVRTSLTTNTVPQDAGVIDFAPTGAVEAAVVLGSPRGGATPSGDVLLYAMRRGGTLQVVSVDGTGAATPGWTGSLFTSGNPSFFASPTLDCSRDASGAGRSGSGTFYAVTSDGRVAAVIVDSPKLATNAPWPKWQRTAGNAGNPGFPLNPGCP